jgi:hypothetical protein
MISLSTFCIEPPGNTGRVIISITGVGLRQADAAAADEIQRLGQPAVQKFKCSKFKVRLWGGVPLADTICNPLDNSLDER